MQMPGNPMIHKRELNKNRPKSNGQLQETRTKRNPFICLERTSPETNIRPVKLGQHQPEPGTVLDPVVKVLRRLHRDVDGMPQPHGAAGLPHQPELHPVGL